MKKLCEELLSRYDSLTSLVVYHRIGEVSAGQCSVLIVAASPHRAHAISAASDCIDLIKTRVPIWKKEFYAHGEHTDESAAWK